MNNYSPHRKARTVFLGIDNGPSGSIGIQEYNANGLMVQSFFMKTPTFMMQDYQKQKKRISQLDFSVLRPIFRQWKKQKVTLISGMERPLLNPGRFVAMVVGMRVHQQWLDLFTFYGFPPPVSLDSREWQKLFLPKGTQGEELKKRSKEIGRKLFPACSLSAKHSDYDGMFICECIRKRSMLNIRS